MEGAGLHSICDAAKVVVTGWTVPTGNEMGVAMTYDPVWPHADGSPQPAVPVPCQPSLSTLLLAYLNGIRYNYKAVRNCLKHLMAPEH